MDVVDGVPPIVRGRFGLEQRCAYKHPDLYDEEVPEIDLETAVAQPELGAGCAVRSFVLLGDQNAGKSTMLHSFCRNGDAGFMQLSSLLPILSSSFLNTRMVPESWLRGQDDINQLSLVRDELPFMDTDIARGLVMLSVENFAFFAQEFGLWDPNRMEEAPEFMNFDPQVRFVTLQFTELGGDHLDRLLLFLRGDLDTVRAAEPRAEPEAEEGFWADMHEVLSASLKLLQETTRTAYFINCRRRALPRRTALPHSSEANAAQAPLPGRCTGRFTQRRDPLLLLTGCLCGPFGLRRVQVLGRCPGNSRRLCRGDWKRPDLLGALGGSCRGPQPGHGLGPQRLSGGRRHRRCGGVAAAGGARGAPAAVPSANAPPADEGARLSTAHRGRHLGAELCRPPWRQPWRRQ
ncbi:unnamed protein product [Symbiodinium sp. CCMP2456]|nr:unnamed protein product [Symbiodinium sp. CCMP2456]